MKIFIKEKRIVFFSKMNIFIKSVYLLSKINNFTKNLNFFNKNEIEFVFLNQKNSIELKKNIILNII